jgi:hypothetical protein
MTMEKTDIVVVLLAAIVRVDGPAQSLSPEKSGRSWPNAGVARKPSSRVPFICRARLADMREASFASCSS